MVCNGSEMASVCHEMASEASEMINEATEIRPQLIEIQGKFNFMLNTFSEIKCKPFAIKGNGCEVGCHTTVIENT